MAKTQNKIIPRQPLTRKMFFLLLVIVLIIAFFIFYRRPQEVKRDPQSNVLLITLDTTRADRLGCSGYTPAQTPNLDRLAAAGVSCEAAYSPVPLTLPAHCTMLSGLYPPAHKVRNNGSYFLPEPVLTLAEMLGQNGYQTSAFVSSFVLDSRFGLGQGFTVFNDEFAGGGVKTYKSERDAAAVFAAFSRWFTGRGAGKFFSWVHFFDPHAPYAPPEPFRSAFSDNPYDGEIAYMDHYIGAILDLLKEKHLMEDTLVVIAGDHGEAFGEHGETGHQVFCYEENLRVPLIFHALKRLPKNMRLKRKVGLTDVMPTILDFLQIPVPAALQGRSLLPAMQKMDTAEPDLYLESFFAHEAFNCAPIQGIIQKNYKYLDLPKPELYDLLQDPGERKNLVSGSAVLGQKMKTSLNELTRRLGGSNMQGQRRMTDAEKNTLASLGYITSAPAAQSAGPLPDPKDKIAGWQVFNRGAEQAANGQTGAAAASLLQAIELIPDYAGSYTILANVYFKNGQGDKALALFRDALIRIPTDATLKTEYAGLLIKMNRLDQGMTQLQELTKTDLVDKKAFVYSQMGSIAETQGKSPQAITYYRQAHENEPDNDGYARKLAYLLHRTNRFAEALAIYRSLEQKQPDDIQLIRDMAIAYAQLNDLEQARSYFTKALQRSPDANLHYNFALLLARQGQYAEAAAMMEKFLIAVPAAAAQAQAARRYLADWRSR
ncbi:MAG: tetratricopeptide repeat protein [Acidobacteria bacterium]|nr:tetratricopeptide repeat protein [Acidobacteriota bacterium]MBU4306268.1 tetratricopeptide repeat protein [Acidobacteriota bacterium]MBU4405233.1 tetratricopeptide repeat protein [Acidobacteriota bacterium]MCG2809957.1 tetratricopeptide repeat protein [Candidatus Aminicenantes bacterium]